MSTVPPKDLNGISRQNRGVYVKPKNMKGVIGRLWKITDGQRKGLVMILIMSVISSCTAVLSPYLTGRMITEISKGNTIFLLLLCLLGIYLSDYLSQLVQQVLLAFFSQRIINHIRKVLFDKMLKLPLSFFDRNLHGTLMSRLTNDIDTISTTLSNSLSLLFSYAFTIAGVFLMMVSLSPMLSLVTLFAVVLIFILTKLVTKMTRKFFYQRQAAFATVSGQVEESVSAMKEVKAFSREKDMVSRFEKDNEYLCEISTKALIWSGLLMPLMNVINNLSYVAIAVLSGVLYVKGIITSVGLITSFLLYVRQFTRPFVEIANVFNNFQTALAGAERVFEIIDEEEEKDEGRLDASSIKGNIVFSHVSFGYGNGRKVLDDINLTIEAGTRVALVGPTGSGKTTIVSLLTRFYDVSEGSIMIDGHDVREYSLSSLRHAFSAVLQDSSLFADTVSANIAYGRNDAGAEDIRKASEEAGAADFIQRLPKKYDTVLEGSGSELSQGERQLVTISRAFLNKAPLMILDEATSNVDTLTEKRIRDSVLKLSMGRTSFMIAHRLATIRDSDLILVIDGGRIIEKGTHDELMAERGFYYDLCMTQQGIWE
ncbi:MAG: ABC transporter ATP-binding protein [Bullifex sp.]